MRLKKVLMLLVMILCMALPQIATAADDTIMPLALYTQKLVVTGEIDVITGELTSSVVVSTSEQCEIYITSDVYRYEDGSWDLVKSFRNPSSGTYVGMSKVYENSCTVTKGYNYMIEATAHVTSVADGISEEISQSSSILSYK